MQIMLYSYILTLQSSIYDIFEVNISVIVKNTAGRCETAIRAVPLTL